MNRIILLGGGSSSGKSYVSDQVIKIVGAKNMTRLSIDDYYINQDAPIEERRKVNYDHPKAFDWDMIRKHALMLKEGKEIRKPVYDYTILNRSDKYENVKPNKLILIEGIMALVDKKLRNLSDLKIFISASPEIRFLRRFIRDHKVRKRTYENIVAQYLETVAPMYKEIIEPSSNYADLIINNNADENRAIDVLSCVLKNELEINESKKPRKPKEKEFTEDILSSVFSKS